MNIDILISIIIIAAFALVIILNVVMGRFVINRAVKRFIKPNLEEHGLVYLGYQWAGFLSTGDFKPEFTLLMMRGRPDPSLYIYVTYLSQGNQKRVTARIDTLFLFIRKVVYSHELI